MQAGFIGIHLISHFEGVFNVFPHTMANSKYWFQLPVIFSSQTFILTLKFLESLEMLSSCNMVSLIFTIYLILKEFSTYSLIHWHIPSICFELQWILSSLKYSYTYMKLISKSICIMFASLTYLDRISEVNPSSLLPQLLVSISYCPNIVNWNPKNPSFSAVKLWKMYFYGYFFL